MRFTIALFLSASLFQVGCGADAVVNDIEINVGVNTGALVQGEAIESEKNIATEQGNPYGAFLSTIQAELNADKAIIQLDNATILLEGDGVHNALEDLFEDTLELRIVDDNAGTDTLIATIDQPEGAEALEFSIENAAFDDEEFQTTLNEGSFKIKLAGSAAENASDANVNLVVNLSFSAFL